MKKKKRNPKATAKDYSKFYGSFAGHTVADMTTPEYYGLMKKDGRVKIDLKRMKKVKISGVPEEVLNAPRRSHEIPHILHQQRCIDTIMFATASAMLLLLCKRNGEKTNWHFPKSPRQKKRKTGYAPRDLWTAFMIMRKLPKKERLLG